MKTTMTVTAYAEIQTIVEVVDNGDWESMRDKAIELAREKRKNLNEWKVICIMPQHDSLNSDYYVSRN